MIQFTVYGKPQPAGSKSSFVPIDKRTGQPYRSKKNGRVVVNIVDANPNARDWKNAVASAARGVYAGELLSGAVSVRFDFYVTRPKGHFGSGKNSGNVKASAPEYPDVNPDVLKLARGVEDALSGVIWRDDAQVVSELLLKRFGEPARVEIKIAPMPAAFDE